MGDYWWLLALVLWAPVFIAALRHRPEGCPTCGHSTGVDQNRCAAVDDVSGLAVDDCRCQNDWHWNYESVH